MEPLTANLDLIPLYALAADLTIKPAEGHYFRRHRRAAAEEPPPMLVPAVHVPTQQVAMSCSTANAAKPSQARTD